MNILTIRATTTDQEIENALPFLDMRQHAIERRNDAAAVLPEQGDETVLEVEEFEGTTVMYSPIFSYAYVNGRSAGVGDSYLLDGEFESVEQAVARYRGGDAYLRAEDWYNACTKDEILAWAESIGLDIFESPDRLVDDWNVRVIEAKAATL